MDLVEQCIGNLAGKPGPCICAGIIPWPWGRTAWWMPGSSLQGAGTWQETWRTAAILVFAATLGTGADHLIGKYNRLQISKAVIMQAAATAMIEEYCDQVCVGLKEDYEADGWYLRPRFSPGYGDFPLDCQSKLLDCLEAGKRIGIKLTDSLLMMPSKSVTAVIGASRKPYRCDVKGCEACGKKDCAYRR